ncbi:phage scaffolding protein [Clostridium botulinum]
MDELNKILGEELYKKLLENVKDKDINLLIDDKKGSKYIEKAKFDNMEQQVRDYKIQLKDRDTQLKDLKIKIKDVKDVKELETKIEDLEKANKDTTEKYEVQINQIKFDTALEKALNKANVHNEKTVKALLNLDNIKLDEDTFIGLNEQLETLKESDSYLFKSENEGREDDDFTGGTGNIGGIHNTKTDNKSFGEILGEKRAKEMSSTKDIEDKFFN